VTGGLLAFVVGADEPDGHLGRSGGPHEFVQDIEDLHEQIARVAAEGVVVIASASVFSSPSASP
jgi:hypothetical protein